ncbi:MAG TPA: zinc-ribbon domain-containing protein, partial [Polyangiaceae bacterium]|nr:zinc-ribbon domain-containing protein [Polyangiaceae bacterium]
ANEFFEETMKISCQACGAKYTIADEKVQGKIAKIRCKRCAATIVVNGPGTAAAESSDSGGGSHDAQGAVYTVNLAENDQRTMTLDEVVRAHQDGLVTGETYVWAEGMDDWLPLASIPALAAALSGRGSSPDSPPEAGSVPAARLDGGRVRVDLFGDVDRAGSEEERGGKAAAAGVAAVGAGARGAPAAPPAEDPSATMTGARNEQSVLFSLQTLGGGSSTAAPAAAAPAASAAAKGGSASADDSGLIDLAALAKAAGDAPAPPPPMMGGLGGLGASPMSPPMMGGPSMLGAPPILGPAMLEAPAMSGSVAPPPKGRTGLYVVIAAALLGSAGVAIAAILALSRPAEPAGGGTGATGVNVPGAGTTADTATPPPAPTPTETAEAPPPSATAPVATAAPVRKPPPSGGGTKPPADKPPAANPAAPPAKPPAAANSNCGCPPGDLNCAIKCSATKKK